MTENKNEKISKISYFRQNIPIQIHKIIDK